MKSRRWKGRRVAEIFRRSLASRCTAVVRNATRQRRLPTSHRNTPSKPNISSSTVPPPSVLHHPLHSRSIPYLDSNYAHSTTLLFKPFTIMKFTTSILFSLGEHPLKLLPPDTLTNIISASLTPLTSAKTKDTHFSRCGPNESKCDRLMWYDTTSCTGDSVR